MVAAEFVAYRFITNADFYNMYKPAGAEPGGGGQTYVDFPTRTITAANWSALLDGPSVTKKAVRRNGPEWTVNVLSIGIPSGPDGQEIHIYQRRGASVCIANQRLLSPSQRRVLAWHPDNGFPEPNDPTDRNQRPAGVVIYLVRTSDGSVWAGWAQYDGVSLAPARDIGARNALGPMLDPANLADGGASGFIDLRGSGVLLDERDHRAPFLSGATVAGGLTPGAPGAAGATRGHHLRPLPAGGREDALLAALMDEDEATMDGSSRGTPVTYSTTRIRVRNRRAVDALKALYGGHCQIRGSEYAFNKRDGDKYSEVHHLIPLGEGGADSPHNMIVVNPLTHRKLHYAEIEGLDLARRVTRPDGWSELRFKINGETATLQWHPRHAELIEALEADASEAEQD